MGLFDIFRRKQEQKSATNAGKSTVSGTVKSTPQLDEHLSLALASLKYYEQCVSQNRPRNYQVLGFKSADSVITLLTDLIKSMSSASKDCYSQPVITEKSRVISIAPDELYNDYDVVAAPMFFLTVCAKDMKGLSNSSGVSILDKACQMYRSIAQPLDDMTSMNGIDSLDSYIGVRNQGYAWVAAAVAQVKRNDVSRHNLTYDDYMNRALHDVEQAMRQRGDL